jgi:hypothetical protein
MNYLDLSRATDALLQTCLAHLDNLIVQGGDPNQVTQARALKEDVLRARIRLAQRQAAGVDFTAEEAQVLENIVPVFAAALPPLP